MRRYECKWEPTAEDTRIGVAVVADPVEHRLGWLVAGHYRELNGNVGAAGTVPFLPDERY